MIKVSCNIWVCESFDTNCFVLNLGKGSISYFCSRLWPWSNNISLVLDCPKNVWDKEHALDLKLRCPDCLTARCRAFGAVAAVAAPYYDRSVNPISTRGAEFINQIDTCPPPFRISDLPTALRRRDCRSSRSMQCTVIKGLLFYIPERFIVEQPCMGCFMLSKAR